MDQVNNYDRSVSIQYLPYAAEADKNRPLNAGEFLFPKFVRLFSHAYRVVGNRDKYFTGLEPEDYPLEERDEIAKVKDDLEAHFGKDTLSPYNKDMWGNNYLQIEKKNTFLNMNDPKDKLMYYLIKGGAFKEVAPSYESAINNASPKRWYVIDANDYAELGAADDKKINKAIAALEELDEEKTFDNMFIVHKFLITSDRGITRKSPKSLMYKDLSDFLHGRIAKTDKRKTPKQFLEAMDILKKDKKKLYINAILKEANYYNFLTVSEDGQLKNLQTGSKYGSTLEKAVAYLTNPANQSELENIKGRVEEKWNQ